MTRKSTRVVFIRDLAWSHTTRPNGLEIKSGVMMRLMDIEWQADLKRSGSSKQIFGSQPISDGRRGDVPRDVRWVKSIDPCECVLVTSSVGWNLIWLYPKWLMVSNGGVTWWGVIQGELSLPKNVAGGLDSSLGGT